MAIAPNPARRIIRVDVPGMSLGMPMADTSRANESGSKRAPVWTAESASTTER